MAYDAATGTTVLFGGFKDLGCCYLGDTGLCRTIGATLATRDTDDFAGTGTELTNPWEMGP